MFIEFITENPPPSLPPLAVAFKLNPLPADADPFLVPVIDRPDFDIPNGIPPGIKQIINGELGITESIVAPAIAPSIKTLNDTPNLSIGEDVTEPTDKFQSRLGDLNDAQKAFLNNAIPSDGGLKSFEKSVVQSMLETQKPAIELIRVLIEMLEVAEDAAARFLGTSIKIPVVDRWVGVPSRNPFYTPGALNFGGDQAKNANFIKQQSQQALDEAKEAFFLTDQFSRIPNSDVSNFDVEPELKESYYIGYYDQQGNAIEPPEWVKKSQKWFADDFPIQTRAGNVPQLSADQFEGVREVIENYSVELSQIQRERSKTLQQMQSEDSSDENSVEQAGQLLDDIETELRNGTEQGAWTEWWTKTVTNQLRLRYDLEPISTARPVTNSNGEPQEPFVTFPTIDTFTGPAEIPVVQAENQIQRFKRGDSEGQVKGLETITTTAPDGTQSSELVEPEYERNRDEFYFNRNKDAQAGLENTRIPEALKRHFKDYKYETVLRYEVRDSQTNQVIRTEEEIIPGSINFEQDYFLRLIRVVNAPTSNVALAQDQDLQGYITSQDVEPNQETGTFFADNNNIPEQYSPNNDHMPEVLDPNTGLLEGQIVHGVDPRYTQVDENQVFWLVEAVRLNEDGTVTINGERQELPSDQNQQETNGPKEWYGLLDKFTVLPYILSRLVPIVTRKFVPMLVKIIQLVTNPSKLREFLDLIIQDKLDLSFGFFNTPYQNKAEVDALNTELQPETIGGKAGKSVYIDPEGNKSFAQDGKASIEILGIFIGFAVQEGTISLLTRDEYDALDLQDQGLFKLVLSMVKLPIDLIKGIVDFFVEWVKKLLNPLTLIQALIELFTFQWIFDLLSPDKILSDLGANGASDLLSGFDFSGLFSIYDDDLQTRLRASLASDSDERFVEVFVYNVFREQEFVRQEIETRPFDGIPEDLQNPLPESLEQIPRTTQDNPAQADINAVSEAVQTALECGQPRFSINGMLPIPFFSSSPRYDVCSLAQIQLKPLELAVGNLKIIEGFINGLISMPTSFLGLEPTLSFPKLAISAPLDSKLENLRSVFSN